MKLFVEGDVLLRRFFEVFLFEDLPASDRHADDVYLAEVERCPIYVGIFGHDYGVPDAAGLSPTQREFDRATAAGKERLIFVKGTDDSLRQPPMAALVRQAGSQLIRRRFSGIPDLTTALNASLVDHLMAKGLVQTRPFEDQRVTDRTILRDLNDLMAKGVLEKVGGTGRATHYIINPQTRHKPDKPDTMLAPALQTKGSEITQMTQARPEDPALKQVTKKVVSVRKGATKGQKGPVKALMPLLRVLSSFAAGATPTPPRFPGASSSAS